MISRKIELNDNEVVTVCACLGIQCMREFQDGETRRAEYLRRLLHKFSEWMDETEPTTDESSEQVKDQVHTDDGPER